MIEARNSDGRISTNEPAKEVSLREALLAHAALRPGGMTDQDRAEIDQIAPEPAPEKPQFGQVGGGRYEVPTGDTLDIKSHEDWLARKEEILKEAFPNDRRYQYR
jgi:hypothetical protein